MDDYHRTFPIYIVYCGRVDHSIISPMWVRASLGARVTCGTSQVLLAGVSGGFSPGTPVFAPPTD